MLNDRSEIAAPPRLFANLASLLASFAGYVRARVELLGLESRTAAGNYLRVLAYAFIAVFALVFGYIFAVLGLVFLVQKWTDWGWAAIAAAFGGAHFLGVVICALSVKRRLGEPALPETLSELRKDRAWLQTNLHSSQKDE